MNTPAKPTLAEERKRLAAVMNARKAVRRAKGMQRG